MRRTIPILFVLALLAACGGAQKKQQLDTTHSALVTAAGAASTAYDLFAVWDHYVEMDIVAKATSAEDGRSKLAAHRVRKGPVVAAFETLGEAMRVARAAFTMPDPDPAKVMQLVTEALHAVLALQQAIAALKEATPS